ncbi:single-stranded-DNA-specific exonuclease RecJ, partial [Morganella morganii]|nr:single-stranded-DNA-specific exonuclease RecJ [Morganella morganii]
AEPLLNPTLAACGFLSHSLAGVGVTFYLLSALRASLRAADWFAPQTIAAPHLAELLDLVALGTVAAVVPLDPNHRILVHPGLNRIRAGRCCAGLTALLE